MRREEITGCSCLLETNVNEKGNESQFDFHFPFKFSAEFINKITTNTTIVFMYVI